DDLLVSRDALGVVELLQLVSRLERSVVVRGLHPRDVRSTRDVAGNLRLLLREVVRRKLLAAVLLRGTDVDELRGASDLAEHLVAERADLRALAAAHGDVALLRRRLVHRELTALELPLLAPAVQELDAVETAELEDPVRVGSEPVVVPAVEHDGRVGVHSGLAEKLREPGLVDVLAARGGVEVGVPVPADRSSDVSLLVRGRVLVHLD